MKGGNRYFRKRKENKEHSFELFSSMATEQER